MEANNSSSTSSSSTMSVSISETFKFGGKGTSLALLLLAMSALVTAFIMIRCIRGRRNDAANVNGQGEADNIELAIAAQNEIHLPPLPVAF